MPEYLIYVRHLLHGDFGARCDPRAHHRNLKMYYPATVELALAAIAARAACIPLGLASAAFLDAGSTT